MPAEVQISIRCAADIQIARGVVRGRAAALGLPKAEITLVTAALSEVARNIVDYAQSGELLIEDVQRGQRRGLRITARDQGPGIADVEKAIQYGYSSRRGLGVGLPGAKWLMDEFDIVSVVGSGTTVTMAKWVPSAD